MHEFKSGWEAVKADGWCVQCLRRDRLPDLALCAECREARNQRSRNRNAARPSTGRRLLKRLADASVSLAAPRCAEADGNAASSGTGHAPGDHSRE